MHRNPAEAIAAAPSAPEIAVARDIAAIEPLWRAFQERAHGTPYQHFDWIASWNATLGTLAGTEPAVVMVHVAGEPVALLPFAIRKRGALKIARFPGDKHANFNLPLYLPERWSLDLHGGPGAFFDQAAAAIGDIDLFELRNQPLAWNGLANPLARAGGQPSPSSGYARRLEPDFEAMFSRILSADGRKKLRKKERSLSEAGPVRFVEASDAGMRERILDAFLEQKRLRMTQLGLSNPFEEPGVVDFLRWGCGLPGEPPSPAITLFALMAGERIVATFGAAMDGRHCCGMFISHDPSPDVVRWSSGEQLIVQILRACCGRGLETFDLGVGEAAYKDTYTPDEVTLFDLFWPTSQAGRLAGLGFSAASHAKRWVKQQPGLMKRLRRWR